MSAYSPRNQARPSSVDVNHDIIVRPAEAPHGAGPASLRGARNGHDNLPERRNEPEPRAQEVELRESIDRIWDYLRADLSNRAVLREVMRKLNHVDIGRQVFEIKVKSYQFLAAGSVYATWLLVDVRATRGGGIQAFEKCDSYYVHKSPLSLGVLIEFGLNNDQRWTAWHGAITLNFESPEFECRTSTARWSERHLIRTLGHECGCNTSLTNMLMDHDAAGICEVRKIAHQALMVIHHELQSKEFMEISSLRLV